MVIFEPVSLEKQDRYLALLKASGIAASDYSFINLWGWAEEYGLEWSFQEGFVWIRQRKPEEMFWSPVGLLGEVGWDEAFTSLQAGEHVFTRVPQHALDIMREHYRGLMEVQEARGHWDYLYAVQDLIALSGNKYHKKKNLLNQFLRKYEHEYIDLTPGLIKEARDMQEKWCRWRDCESSETLSAENRVIDRVLGSWDKLGGIMGGAILVGGRMVAFCIAEESSPKSLIIHFEKGFTDYAGIYQAMNQMFLAAHPGFDIVNREQDLDEEGLRKAKLSYLPAGFIRKYRLVVSV